MPIVTCADIGQSLTDAFNDPNQSSVVKDAIRNALDCDCAKKDLVFRIRVPQNVIDGGYEIELFNMDGSEFDSLCSIKMDWGDGVGTSEAACNPYRYTAAGDYTVTVSYKGDFVIFRQVNFVIPENLGVELLEVITFGHFEKVKFQSVGGNFKVPAQLSPNMRDLSRMFYDAVDFNQPLATWDTSAITDMREMFTHAVAFNQPLATWDTSAVTDMHGMFDSTDRFNQDISSWNTSAVTDMGRMFFVADAFNQDLSSWNVANVTSCNQFSAGASAWTLPKPALTC